jgi:uncharacterized membrane protein
MFEITYLPGHEVPTGLPFTREELARYDAIILSDIGANSVLLPPDVFLGGKPRPNRLKLIREWTRDGGGLVMAGGYLSFQGIDGRGRWVRTPVEEALPVTMLRFDERLEIPDGFRPQIIGSETHPILKGLSGEWPLLLGANEVSVKQNIGVEQLVRLPDEEVATLCWLWLPSAPGDPSHGRRTSARIGFPPSSSTGLATRCCGAISCLGRRN